ncbi:MAG: TRAP transporter small permease [Alphaproteobacteria bacterium]|nr:TRAP transporter small permease [Alphaproteobacteria bacterium]
MSENPPEVVGGETVAAFEEDLNHVDLRQYGIEDWITFVLFWALTIVVFLQFFTRYILNDSLAWTEEIARYLLMVVTFIGCGMAVRRMTHIHVEFFYLYLPPRVGFWLSTLVDLIRLAFFAYCTWLAWKVAVIMHGQRMVVFDLPLSWVFGPVVPGFAIATIRSLQVAVRHWRTGESPLTRTAAEGRRQ